MGVACEESRWYTNLHIFVTINWHGFYGTAQAQRRTCAQVSIYWC